MTEEKSSQAAKGWDEEQEDEEEDDVCSQCNDHVDEAEDTHVDLEKGEGRHEGRIGRCGIRFGRGVCDRSVVERCEGGSKSQPESTEGAEYDEWEGVSKNELEERTHDHEQTTEEVVGTTV